jgi:trimeric autotransporter adhesin
MRKFLLLLICLDCCIALFSQEKMYIHKSDLITLGAPVSETDSASFSADGSTIYFRIGGNIAQYAISTIDSISFGDNSDTIYVNYLGSKVSVINPLAFEGVSVSVSGADVTVTSTTETQDINYKLSGATTDGMFKIYSEKRFNLLLNGVTITHTDGPAINIQSEKKASVTLVKGTTSSLTDGSTYAAAVTGADGEAEDQGAAFFGEGKIVIDGSGNLTVNGKGTDKNALSSESIEINNGTITVASSLKDGIHGKDGIIIAGGTVKVTSTGDAIDGDSGDMLISGGSVTISNTAASANGIVCDSTLEITGGTVVITVGGNQAKGIKSAQLMTLSGGNITVTTSGGVALEASGSGYNPAYCTAIKCDSNLVVNGATILIKGTGIANKGISSAYHISMESGSVNITLSGNGGTYKNSSGTTDSYSSTGITADGNISILGGSITITNSGTGGKGITADGTLNVGNTSSSPTLKVTTNGTKFLVSGSDYTKPKAVKSEGAMSIANGTTTITSNDKGLESATSITIGNASVFITQSVEGMEAPYITVNGDSIRIYASDDGFNATKGNGSESSDGSCLTINKGYIYVNTTTGDGLDSNGNIVIAGGKVIVHGPQSSPEVGMDYNGTCNVTGGMLIVSGTNSDMTQAPSTSSTLYPVKIMSRNSMNNSTLFHIQDESGKDILTFQPVRSYYSIVFASSTLVSGAKYYVYTGGSSTGTNTDGLYSGGTYSGGTQKTYFSISGKVTTVNLN